MAGVEPVYSANRGQSCSWRAVDGAHRATGRSRDVVSADGPGRRACQRVPLEGETPGAGYVRWNALLRTARLGRTAHALRSEGGIHGSTGPAYGRRIESLDAERIRN